MPAALTTDLPHPARRNKTEPSFTPHRSLPATKDALVLTAINTMHPTASLPLIPQALPAAENTPIALSTFRKPA